MYRRFFDVSRGSAEKETQEAYFQKSMLATFLGLLAEWLQSYRHSLLVTLQYS